MLTLLIILAAAFVAYIIGHWVGFGKGETDRQERVDAINRAHSVRNPKG